MLRYIILYFTVFTSLALAQNEWSFLNTSRIGAKQFVTKHPGADGKNKIIFIMDSGVDPGVPGLINGPDGSPKVIDLLDFSEEGDVYLEPAKKGIENDEKYLSTYNGLKLFGYNLLGEQAVDSVYLIGALDERNFLNSKVKDINSNGKTDDRFGLILFQKETDDWIAYIDLDADGNLSDEKPQKDYSVNKQVLKFRGFEEQYEYLPLNMGLKLYPDEQKVNFHYDGSGHGTHVAGIAAGYKINNVATLNGIAPGAKIISLKIGDSRYGRAGTVTGSMQSAYEYVAEFAQKYDGTVIVNMSYGIGSETEGRSDMEEYLDDLLAENPNIIACLSSGNGGPGISTVGLPASASSAISVGALNTVDNARDIYAGNINSDKLFLFSSRGGEVNKPDIIAPGAASSTIPPFSSSENKRGTSMASPQVAGAVALLLSAMSIENPSKKVDAYSIKMSIINSASPLKEYLPIDQGNGVINISAAYDLLIKYSDRKEIINGYEISTISPVFPDSYGPAVYWRLGTYLPTKEDQQTVYVNAIFKNEIAAEKKNDFYRAFKLSTNADWLKIVQQNIYIKGASPAKIQIYCDEEKMQLPGIYSTYINGFEKTGIFGSKSDENKQFQVLCTVIIPNRINTNKNTTLYKNKVKLSPGEIYREFILAPSNSSGMALRIKQNNREYGNIKVYTYNQEGHKKGSILYWNSDNSGEATSRVITDALTPGIWEFVFCAPFTNPEISFFDYEIGFSGLEIQQDKISQISIKNGEKPAGTFTAINQFSKALKAKIGGRVQGVQRKFQLMEEFETYQHSFNVSDLYKSVEFEIQLPKKTYNKLTDFTVNIKNNSGKVLKTTGITTKKLKIEFIPPSSESYTLELIPGFTFEGQTWDAEIKESFYYFRQPSVKGQNINFYPYIKKKVFFSLNSQIDVAPNGYYLFGEIRIDSVDKNKVRTIIPIEISSNLY